MTTHTPTDATGLDAQLRQPWTVTDELARLVAQEHCRDPRTGRCAGCGYRPSRQFPRCRSHIVARALYQHSQITELPPAENQTTPADVPAVDQLALFPAKPHANGRTRP